MTTHRSAKTVTRPAQPVERAVTAALVLAVVAGLAWIGGMFWTLLGWRM
ncbi:morphogenic membrane protein MmpA [Streptomyces sp. NPDC048710]